MNIHFGIRGLIIAFIFSMLNIQNAFADSCYDQGGHWESCGFLGLLNCCMTSSSLKPRNANKPSQGSPVKNISR